MPTIFRNIVTVGAITFNDPLVKPAGAQSWGLDVMDGWRDSPEVTVFTTELGGEVDGDSDGDFFPIRSRYLVVGGYVLAETAETAEELQTLLLRDAFPRNTRFDVVRNEAVAKFVEARRAASLTTEWTMPNGFRWETTLKAADPFKYGVSDETATAGVAGISSGGLVPPLVPPLTPTTVAGAGDSSADIFNRGDAPSQYLVATITGPLAKGGWRLRNDTTDGELFYDIGLVAGDSLEIDFRAELARLNGYVISSELSGDFWQLAPGSNAIRLYADYDVGTTLSVTAKSAWE
jgi:hypothetical protein